MKQRYILIFVIAVGLVFALLFFRRVTVHPQAAPVVASTAPAPKHPAATAAQPPAAAPSNQSAMVRPPSAVMNAVRRGGSAGNKMPAEREPDSARDAVNQQKPYDQRIAAVERISDLSAVGAQTAMIDYLLRPLPYMDGNWWRDEYELRNNMLNKLLEYPADPGAVSETLLKIYRDPDQGDVLRGYAVQHIAGWIKSGELASGDREQLLGAVRDAAAKVDNPAIGGAGLIAMREVGPAEEAGVLAMKALNSRNACPESRISAFQVCAELGVDKALEPARVALADRNAPAVLRMSAVNVLARLGGPADERLLQKMSASGSGVIRGQSAEQYVIAGRYNNDQDELVRNAARLALASRKSKGR